MVKPVCLWQLSRLKSKLMMLMVWRLFFSQYSLKQWHAVSHFNFIHYSKSESTFSFVWHVKPCNRSVFSQIFLSGSFSWRNLSPIKLFSSCPRNYYALFLQCGFFVLVIGVGNYEIINREKIRYNTEHSTWYPSIHFPDFQYTPCAPCTGSVSIANTAMSNRTTTRSFLSLLNNASCD